MKQQKQSQVAKSLEKIALEKGLIKPEKTFKKVAEAISAIPNDKPNEDLAINVINLCAQLRNQGFNKYADNIESKFLQYKKAECYDVTKEKGEDLVDWAHPKGSLKLTDMEGDSVIETILDKHKKIEDVINKTPTGKLAAKDAANMVKVLFAQMNLQKLDSDIAKEWTSDQIASSLNTYWSDAKNKWKQIDQTVRTKGGLSYAPVVGRGLQYWGSAGAVTDQFNKRPDLDVVDDLKDRIKDSALGTNIKDFVKPGMTGGISHEAWAELGNGDDFDKLYDDLVWVEKLLNAQILQQRGNSQQTQPSAGHQTESPATNQAFARGTTLYNKVLQSKKLTDDKKEDVYKWLKDIANKLNNPATFSEGEKELTEAEQALAPYI